MDNFTTELTILLASQADELGKEYPDFWDNHREFLLDNKEHPYYEQWEKQLASTDAGTVLLIEDTIHPNATTKDWGIALVNCVMA